MTIADALSRFSPLPDGRAIVDQQTGLLWEAVPDPGTITWSAAVRAAGSEGWRLPTIGELMDLLEGLPAPSLAAPEVGSVLWSSSESPFAPATRVRVVACEPGPRFVVRLLDRHALARRWLVRSGG